MKSKNVKVHATLTFREAAAVVDALRAALRDPKVRRVPILTALWTLSDAAQRADARLCEKGAAS